MEPLAKLVDCYCKQSPLARGLGDSDVIPICEEGLLRKPWKQDDDLERLLIAFQAWEDVENTFKKRVNSTEYSMYLTGEVKAL